MPSPLLNTLSPPDLHRLPQNFSWFLVMLFWYNNFLLQIFSYLDLADISHCAQVCRSWKMITSYSSLWSRVNLSSIKSRSVYTWHVLIQETEYYECIIHVHTSTLLLQLHEIWSAVPPLPDGTMQILDSGRGSFKIVIMLFTCQRLSGQYRFQRFKLQNIRMLQFCTDYRQLNISSFCLLYVLNF